MANRESIQAIRPYEAYLFRPIDDVAGDLEVLIALLNKWQRIQNLVSRETLKDVWTRHIADSLQVLKSVSETDRIFVDIGSGGGFPALPLAVASKGSDRVFMLVEPTGRKASFLKTVSRELSLSTRVENSRIEDIDSRETLAPDVITSRALASLDALCGMVSPIFGPRTRAIFHKGREHVDELAESSANWHYDVLVTASDTDPNGVLIELRNLRSKHK